MSGHRRVVASLCGLGIAAATTLPCIAADRAIGEHQLMQGHADEAVSTFKQVLSQNPRDGKAHLLLCRAYYAQELADPAIAECEAALNTLGNSSEIQDWLGRAYGKKADQSGPIAGYKLAKRVKTAFESAVDLDPKNPDAVNDLSEYYVGAPAMVGGGTDKAFDLARRVEAALPQSAFRMRGLAAEKDKDYGTAEREFHSAVSAGGRIEAWIDLANYYSRRKQGDQCVDAVKHAVALDRTLDASLVDAGSILYDAHREPKLAISLLRSYIDKGTKSDAAPVFKAQTILGKILTREGDKAGARIAYQQALALASNYEPAKKALAKL